MTGSRELKEKNDRLASELGGLRRQLEEAERTIRGLRDELAQARRNTQEYAWWKERFDSAREQLNDICDQIQQL